MSNGLYIPRSGEQVYPPPYSADGVQLYGFVVEADAATMQRTVCDRFLNAPLGAGAQRFRIASAHVLFVFNTIDRLRSLTPPFDQQGWFPEQEAAVWTIVCDTERQRLFWFHPYMLVDNSYAAAMGREIYGFPKQLGWFEIPRGPDAPQRLSVETLAVQRFGPDAPGLRQPLFSVRQGSAGGDHTVFGELRELAAELMRIARLEPGALRELGLGAHLLQDVAERLMPMAFLKQFRDGAQPLQACYQAIQEVDSRLVRLHGAKLFGDRYAVDINDLDSHPVRADLGLPPGPADVRAAFWLNFDFAIGDCTEVWRGPAAAAPVPPPVQAPPPSAAPPAGGAPLPSGAAPSPSPAPRRRIAILGGGAAAMAAAWRLTSEPGWQERFEITLYQMGWRLGGKGASGRREPHGRIEEHGLHIWLGFYHNAFGALQQAHRELNPGVDESVAAGHAPPRIANGVFARCEDAFQPHGYVGIDMDIGPGWQPWMMQTPMTGDKPWQRGRSLPTPLEYARMLGEFLAGKAFDDDLRPVYEREQREAHGGVRAWLEREARHLLLDVEEGLWSAGRALLGALGAQLRAGPIGQPGGHPMLDALLSRLQAWMAHEFDRQTLDSPDARRHFLLLDMASTILRGLLADGAFEIERFRALDGEFRHWLQRHGAMPATASLAANPLLRGLYDFVFAFDGGDTRDLDATANFATAPALRTVLRMCFTYDGSIFWKMRAGMGDTIFTPFYKALVQRGVRFEFFHRVRALRLDDAGQAVQRIEIARQVTPRAAAGYAPLKNWGGLDCWPATPDYDQLVEGEALRAAVDAQQLDLESQWFRWDDADPHRVLERGRDFDDVVFAIALGSVPQVAGDLVQASPRWREMVERVRTVRTQAVQLWMRPDLRGLGWLTESPVIDAYLEPFDTWADMSHLLPREAWAAGAAPGSVGYFCGALRGDSVDASDPSQPVEARAAVEAAARERLFQSMGALWPGAARPDGSLDESQVVDRYLRFNIDPTERYVMSVAGSSQARLKADATGVSNLVICGDWIDNGFNAGCVEAAVMSGLQAANALLGRDLNDGVLGRELC